MPRERASAIHTMFTEPRQRTGTTRTHGFQLRRRAAAASSAGRASFSHSSATIRGFSSSSSGTSTALIMEATPSTE